MFKSEKYPHIPIVFTFDRNYLFTAGACFYSLLDSIKKADKKVYYTLHALTIGLTDEDIAKLHQIVEPFKEFATLQHKDISDFLNTLKNPFSERFLKRFAKIVLVKYFLSELFLEYEKVVFSDVDVIFCQEFSDDFLKIDENDTNYFHGVFSSQHFPPADNHMYEGFLFCNLAYQRKNHFAQKVLNILNNQNIRTEPELTNHCWPHIARLGVKYCVAPNYYDFYKNNQESLWACLYKGDHPHIKEALDNPIIIHYDYNYFTAAGKPWNNPLELKANLWLNALAKTPFFNDYTLLLNENSEYYSNIIATTYCFGPRRVMTGILFDMPKWFFRHYFKYVFVHKAVIKSESLKYANMYIDDRIRYFKSLKPYCSRWGFKFVFFETLKVLKIHAPLKKIYRLIKRR
ncbi:glycosyltransferase [Helicobacter cetorum]|uniref:Lipopolysaccharide biosynthesis protein n=1 Tax=Helicobacter cetorum (strain ATCC BAA-540 / CCUG 52418 / MIT 99-5656) TaxID=1163745 RepID=I0ESX2_HELCM|nr:glycosyltransferase [Helicobacter cetorum]AFI06041.1 lipopolysaccharide biosynthesis protein [Helicobacter cetorum MIT 99-5656]